MTGMHDWELVARAREGDMDGFAELVRRYQKPVMHFCRRMMASPQDAEEVAQDAFVRVYRHLPHLKPQAKFSTFLFGVARNLALNAIRDAQRRNPKLEFASNAPGMSEQRPDQIATLRELESALDNALQQLTPEHREILILREIQGMDYDAIAEVVQCRKGTVKSRLARAREQLRLQLLGERGGF
jgi:RNA polymerase sigma-70 factor, ECF subfamily